jgi:hypothetical protein
MWSRPHGISFHVLVYRQCVRPARVTCPHRGGSWIHARGLMQRTFMREHFCVTCGQALHYSPEDGH